MATKSKRRKNPTLILQLELLNPASAAFKKMMNLIHQRMENQLITRKLIELFIANEYHLSQKEREEILQKFYAHQSAITKYQTALYPLQQRTTPLLTKAPINLITQELKMDKRHFHIQELINQCEDINIKLNELKQETEKNTQAWKTQAGNEAKEFVNKLKANNIVFHAIDNNIITLESEQAKDIFEAIAENISVTPLTNPKNLIDILVNAYADENKSNENKSESTNNSSDKASNKSLDQDQSKQENITSFGLPFGARQMVLNSMVMKEINLVGVLAGLKKTLPANENVTNTENMENMENINNSEHPDHSNDNYNTEMETESSESINENIPNLAKNMLDSMKKNKTALNYFADVGNSIENVEIKTAIYTDAFNIKHKEISLNKEYSVTRYQLEKLKSIQEHEMNNYFKQTGKMYQPKNLSVDEQKEFSNISKKF